MLGRRLLMVARGSGVFAPPLPELRAVLASPLGGWTQIQSPKAVAHAGYTYIGCLNGSTGEEQVSAFHNATATASAPVTLHASFGVTDNHASPACLVMASSHKLLVAYSAHDGPTLYTRLSTDSLDSDPTLSGGFAAELTPRTSGDWTYAVLVQLDTGEVFLFYRYFAGGTGYLEYVKSTDEGASWGSPVQIFGSTAGHVAYWRIGSDGTKIHVITTDIEPTASATFHFYMLADGSLHKSDGTTLGAFIHSTDCTPVLSAAGGANWSWGVSANGDGPASVLMVDIGSDNAIKTARWRSGAWQINTVVASVGGQVAGNQYASGCGIHPTNPNVVYVAKKATKWEMWRYVSGDDGASWSGTQLTSGSAVDQLWADAVHDAGAGLEAIWLAGTYTSDTSYAFGVAGWG